MAREGDCLMFLYRGSNVEVCKPRVIVTSRTLDFGAGFYTTSDLGQAKRWACLQTRRRGEGTPAVSVFEYDVEAAQRLKVRVFPGPDGEWLDFVCENRKAIYCGEKHDIVVGPVANDSTMPVISDYMAGFTDRPTAITLLKPQRLTDQYAFLTASGIGTLRHVETRYYDE